MPIAAPIYKLWQTGREPKTNGFAHHRYYLNRISFFGSWIIVVEHWKLRHTIRIIYETMTENTIIKFDIIVVIYNVSWLSRVPIYIIQLRLFKDGKYFWRTLRAINVRKACMSYNACDDYYSICKLTCFSIPNTIFCCCLATCTKKCHLLSDNN